MLGIIGGSGFYKYDKVEKGTYKKVVTDLGEPSAEILEGELGGKRVAFLARHGVGHTIAPAKINYRANILALKEIGVTEIIGVNAVGAISRIENGSLVIPTDLIDYSYGRESSFADGEYKDLKHIDFSDPFTRRMQEKLLEAGRVAGIELGLGGVYGVTQGIRLETRAEIARMRRDGCSIVGMTLMPEAVLAREVGIEYTSVSIVVNAAAGVTEEEISIEEIERNLNESISKVEELIYAYSTMSD